MRVVVIEVISIFSRYFNLKIKIIIRNHIMEENTINLIEDIEEEKMNRIMSLKSKTT